MLDTNIASALLKGHDKVLAQATVHPPSALCISVITEAEIAFGLAKRPQARNLHRLVREFLRRIKSLPFESETAAVYGRLRADLNRQGISLSHPDLLIAAHATACGAILISADRAFSHIRELKVENWQA